jgi:hypothetical protein
VQSQRILCILGATWLGHGRASELMLTFILAFSGLILFFLPNGVWLSQLTIDIAWAGYGNFVSYPFLTAAAIKGLGLYMNIVGAPMSRAVRFVGAFLAGFLWAWYCAKFALLGAPGPNGVPLDLNVAQIIAISTAFTGVLFSIRVMAMAMANLPVPGALGRLR